MWIKFRHKIVFAILHPIFVVYLWVRYGYRAKKYQLEKGPYVMLFNHPTNLDPFMMALSFRGPIYFMANDDLFNIPVISPIIRYLVAPIPKAKSVRDIQAVKDCIRIVKEGGRIGIAPEGNRNYSGRVNYIDKAIVKLIKLLKVPVVLYNIYGGYGVNPRFSKRLHKGKMHGQVRRILSVEEVNDYPDNELYDIIVQSLDVNDLELNYKYRGKALAENLESVFYVCPVCHSLSTIVSRKNHLQCTHCNLEVEYTESLTFRTKNDKFSFNTVFDYYRYQEDFIRNQDLNLLKFSDHLVTLRQVIKNKRKFDIMQGSLSFDQNSLIVKSKNVIREFSYENIISLAVVYHNTLIINLEDATYHIVADNRFNALKYLHLFYQVKNIKQGVRNGFLGI